MDEPHYVFRVPVSATDLIREAFPPGEIGSKADAEHRRILVPSRELAQFVSTAQALGIEVGAPRANRRTLRQDATDGTGTRLSKTIDGFFQLKALGADCASCRSLVDQMNTMGPRWCIRKRHTIAEQMVTNLKSLSSTLKGSKFLHVCGWAAGMPVTRVLLKEAAAFMIQDAAKGVLKAMPEKPTVPPGWEDPLQIVTKTKDRTDALRDSMKGTPVGFIIGGGPSFDDAAAIQLARRGIFGMAINNAACHPIYRPQAMVCADPPSKFHDGIWKDPGIMKFCPIPKLRTGRGKLRSRDSDGQFWHPGIATCDCPNVWGFLRRAWIEHNETFFMDEGASWGNLDEGVLRTGGPKGVCTLLLAIRLMYYLGFRRLYLVGVDFNMYPGQGYFYNEERTISDADSNNHLYKTTIGHLAALQDRGIFEAFGLEIIQTNAASRLDVFKHVPLEDATADALDGFPRQPWDMSGWYSKRVDK
jgi:hypothetical protein